MKNLREKLSDPEVKKQINRDLFDHISSKYNRATRLLSFGRDNYWKLDLVKSLPSGDGEIEILDLATGTGDVVALLLEKYSRAKITGIDLSPEMIVISSSRFAGNEQVELRVGDICEMPFEDNCFDMVTGSYALRNVPELDKALAEIARVLKPGACAAFLDFEQPESGLRRAWNHGLLHAWGGLVGLFLHGKPWIYRYIPHSLSHFPTNEKLDAQLSSAGMGFVERKAYFGGLLQRVNVRLTSGD